MTRARIERQRAVRVWREHLRTLHPRGPIFCDCEFQVGRFRKRQRVAGYGNSRCFLCHGDKLMGRPTMQELRARDVERDSLREIDLGESRTKGSTGQPPTHDSAESVAARSGGCP